MGFWHTGYMEFHEPTGEGVGARTEPRPPTFPCPKCGVEFTSDRDLRVHTFEGHPVRRPVLVLKGRECGRSRLTVTGETSPDDWVIRTADVVAINGEPTSVAGAVEMLSTRRSGVLDVTLANGDVAQEFQFEFTLAEASDLDGVDAALERLIDGGELSLRAIDDFIMRSKRYPTASRYLAGLANYLYGVLAREGAAEVAAPDPSHEGAGYEGKYDQAVGILGTFDRAPAEAICGIVAFHYNQFDRAMTKTKSRRVAEVSMRFQAMLRGETWSTRDLSVSPHSSLDFALSDSVIEQVLEWSSLPLDGTATVAVTEMVASIDGQRPYDAFKLHMVAAEHSLSTGDVASAVHHAERLRHGRITEGWYADFRRRLEGVAQP
jgi:hypothetical protein